MSAGVAVPGHLRHPTLDTFLQRTVQDVRLLVHHDVSLEVFEFSADHLFAAPTQKRLGLQFHDPFVYLGYPLTAASVDRAHSPG